MGIFLKQLPRSAWIVGLLALIATALWSAAAKAESYPPAPQGEDFAFIQLGSVGELVTLELYRSAAASDALEPRERKTFSRLAKQKAKAWERMNALLGEDAITDDDFAVKIPTSVLRSGSEATALAARFERFTAGLYLSGVQSAIDPPTRLLLGKHLAASSRNLTIVRELRDGKTDLRPLKPLSVEYVGTQFDSYLTIPGA